MMDMALLDTRVHNSVKWHMAGPIDRTTDRQRSQRQRRNQSNKEDVYTCEHTPRTPRSLGPV